MRNSTSKIYKFLGSDGKFHESAEKGCFGGHKKLKIYEKPDCKSALGFIEKGLYVKERVFFKDEETAIAAGFHSCARCLFEKYKH